jgi:hypothetical protein
MMSDKYTISVKKRPLTEWILWALWLILEIFVVQNAIASGQELEPRAAAIFWVTFVVLLLAGAVVWFVRRNK